MWNDSGEPQVPIATLDQDLDDDFQLLPGEDSPDEQKWTCKKCTLVNSGRSLICEVCCGSKLRSLSITNDMTLRKGEFWSCSKCTLKNPLNVIYCKACKTEKIVLDVPSTTTTAQTRSPSPRHHHQSSRKHTSNSSSKSSHKSNHQQQQKVNSKISPNRFQLISEVEQSEYLNIYLLFKYL